jgi:transposase
VHEEAHEAAHPTPVAPAVAHRPLTDAEWQHILPLLPPQRLPIGRSRHDHHTVLTSILPVLCSGASLREMPRDYGKWETAYKRYRLRQGEGRLQPILEALDLPTPYPPP